MEALSAETLQTMQRRALQDLAKRHGIRANQKSETIIHELLDRADRADDQAADDQAANDKANDDENVLASANRRDERDGEGSGGSKQRRTHAPATPEKQGGTHRSRRAASSARPVKAKKAPSSSAAPSPSARALRAADRSASFAPGDAVLALWEERGGSSAEWLPAVLGPADGEGGECTWEVRWEDGTISYRVPSRELRHAEERHVQRSVQRGDGPQSPQSPEGAPRLRLRFREGDDARHGAGEGEIEGEGAAEGEIKGEGELGGEIEGEGGSSLARRNPRRKPGGPGPRPRRSGRITSHFKSKKKKKQQRQRQQGRRRGVVPPQPPETPEARRPVPATKKVGPFQAAAEEDGAEEAEAAAAGVSSVGDLMQVGTLPRGVCRCHCMVIVW